MPRQIAICQITAELLGKDVVSSMEEARRQSLAWLQRRSGKLPKMAWDHLSFENPTPGMQAQAVRLQTGEVDYWCARLDDNDKNVAGRVWTTELSVAHKGSESRAVFGLRQIVTTSEDEPAFTPALPGVIRQISERPGLAGDGRAISEQPLMTSEKAEVDRLIGLIEDPMRTMPIYVLALGENQTDKNNALLDAKVLTRRCIGMAHVVVITGPASYALTDQLGKSLSVFHHAVRTYRPGFDYGDSPFDHPLALPHAISTWNDIGPEAFADFLVGRAASESLKRGRGDTDLPRFSSVKQAHLDLARRAAEQTEENALTLAIDEIDALKQEVEDWQSIGMSAEDQVSDLERQLRELEGQNAYLRSRISGLEQQIETTHGRSVDQEISIPESLDELRAWAEQNLAGRVLVTGKAARAAKNSLFQDNILPYKAVLFLANEYREMRLKGDDASRQAYQSKLGELGLEDSLSGEETRLREQGDEFYVQHGNRKHFLKNHLKNGNARDPRYCFRCYYFWDDETEQVVVGSLPGHLRTNIS